MLLLVGSALTDPEEGRTSGGTNIRIFEYSFGPREYQISEDLFHLWIFEYLVIRIDMPQMDRNGQLSNP